MPVHCADFARDPPRGAVILSQILFADHLISQHANSGGCSPLLRAFSFRPDCKGLKSKPAPFENQPPKGAAPDVQIHPRVSLPIPRTLLIAITNHDTRQKVA